MSDANLLMFGCGILGLAVGGAYIVIREQYLFGRGQEARVPVRSSRVVELARRREQRAQARRRAS